MTKMAKFKSYDEDELDLDDYGRGRKFNKREVRDKRSAKNSSRWSEYDNHSNDNSTYDEY